jgi:uncharacterized DUF497 family protein
LEFEWDSRKARTNLAKHKVSYEDAASVFGNPLGRIVADPRHSAVEERLVLLGVSNKRRLPTVMYIEREEAVRIISPDGQRAPRKGTMKRSTNKGAADRVNADAILPEYDFKRGAPNKFAPRYASGSGVIVLEPHLAAAFPNSEGANAALRALAGIIRKHSGRQWSSRRSLITSWLPFLLRPERLINHPNRWAARADPGDHMPTFRCWIRL